MSAKRTSPGHGATGTLTKLKDTKIDSVIVKAAKEHGAKLDDPEEEIDSAKAAITTADEKAATSRKAATDAKINCFVRGTALALSLCRTLGFAATVKKLRGKLKRGSYENQDPIMLTFELMGAGKSTASRWATGARNLLKQGKSPEEFAEAITATGGFTKCLQKAAPPRVHSAKAKAIKIAAGVQDWFDRHADGDRFVVLYVNKKEGAVSLNAVSLDPEVCHSAKFRYNEEGLSHVHGRIPKNLKIRTLKRKPVNLSRFKISPLKQSYFNR